MARLMFDQLVYRMRAEEIGRDKHGQPIRDWANADEKPYEDVSMLPAGSSESSAQPGMRVVTGWALQTRAGHDMDLLPIDRIRWGDRVLEVIGEIARYPHPIKRGQVHHVEVRLQQVRG